MTYKECKAFFGNQETIAAVLGLSQPTVSAWRQADGKHVVPELYQFKIEVLTAGALRVDPKLRKLPVGRAIFEY